MGRPAAHGPLAGLDDGRLREGRPALEGLPAEPLPAQPSPRLTFTGRFRAGRAHEVLVAALALLAAPPSACLAGDGPARQAVIRLMSACGLGRLVRLPGWAHEQPCVKRHRFILFQQPLEGFVESGVVGGAVLAAVPDPI